MNKNTKFWPPRPSAPGWEVCMPVRRSRPTTPAASAASAPLPSRRTRRRPPAASAASAPLPFRRPRRRPRAPPAIASAASAPLFSLHAAPLPLRFHRFVAAHRRRKHCLHRMPVACAVTHGLHTPKLVTRQPAHRLHGRRVFTIVVAVGAGGGGGASAAATKLLHFALGKCVALAEKHPRGGTDGTKEVAATERA